MVTKNIHKLLLTGLTIFVLLAAFSFLSDSDTPVNASNVLSLQAPPFVGQASASSAKTVSAAAFLEDEAGIAAYTNIAGTIDLSIVRDEFRAIEQETSQYIIGSVGIPDYTENFDPHVYVHTDGWIVAYYLVADPASRIIDLRHYDGIAINTMLEGAIEKLLTVIGVVTFDTNYYDFRYPNATNLVLVAEASYDFGDDSFEVKLPSDFTYYERSWTHALHSIWYHNSKLYLDEVEISSLEDDGDAWKFNHGTFTPAQLPPGVFHTIKINLGGHSYDPDAFGGIALVYQEGP